MLKPASGGGNLNRNLGDGGVVNSMGGLKQDRVTSTDYRPPRKVSIDKLPKSPIKTLAPDLVLGGSTVYQSFSLS
jgi:hypothetical protein